MSKGTVISTRGTDLVSFPPGYISGQDVLDKMRKDNDEVAVMKEN